MGIHVVLGAVCLAAGACARGRLHDILLTMGVILAAGFVPVIMGIYFMWGFLESGNSSI